MFSNYRFHFNLFLHDYVVVTFACDHWSKPQGALETQLKCNKLLHLLLFQSIGIIKVLSCWEDFFIKSLIEWLGVIDMREINVFNKTVITIMKFYYTIYESVIFLFL